MQLNDMDYPKVIVLTLNWNGKSLMDDCLSSYLANDYPNFEVVMIDNGSTDGSVEYVRQKFPQVNILENGKNLGYSGGFNKGLEYAFDRNNADYVLITNNDVKSDDRIISALVETAETDPIIGFTIGKVYYFDQPDILQTVGKRDDPVKLNGGHIGAHETDTGQYDVPAERAFCDDIYWLVKRELYEKTGGYDTTFFLQAEDFDWQVRAKDLGYKLMYTPDAKLWHKESMTLGKTSAKKAYYDTRNPLIVIMKHKSPEFIKQYFRYFLKNQVITPSFTLLFKRLAFNKFCKIWQGFFSAIIWGIKNEKISLLSLVRK
jgi:GT2 family glycosyltransferase